MDKPVYTYRAKVTEVLDGDTVECLVDLGFHVKTVVRIRMADVFAPETRTRDLDEKRFGIMAKINLEKLCLGRDVIISTDKTRSFNRWVGEITRESDQLDVNGMMIEYCERLEKYE